MEFEFGVQIIDKFTGGGLVFIYLAAFLVIVRINLVSKNRALIWQSMAAVFGIQRGY